MVTNCVETTCTETGHPVGKGAPKLPKELYVSKPIDWSIITLAVVNFVIWLTTQILYSYELLPFYICLPLWSICHHVGWTPLHEASHSNIATKKSGYGWLNFAVGQASAMVYFHCPFRLVKYSHLTHHKYANDPEKDPDYFASGEAPFVVIRWFLQMYAYIVGYWKAWNTRPKSERIEFIVMMVVFFGFKIYDAYCGGPWQLKWRWMLPTWLGAGWTVFAFDYIPHRPHSNKNIFAGTNITTLDGYNSALTLLIFGNNYHIIHHLYPWIPFYKLESTWFKMKETLIKKGTKVRPLFPIFS